MTGGFSKVRSIVGGRTVTGKAVPLRVTDDGELTGVGGSGGSLSISPLGVTFAHGTGQTVVFTTAVAGTSAALTSGKRVWYWADEDVWIRLISGDADSTSFPIMARERWLYQPSAPGETISVLGITAAGNLYIGEEV